MSAAPTPDVIAPNDRLVALGMTGTGKSEILLAGFAQTPGQRLLIDYNDAYTLGPDALADELGCQEVDDPKRIDWSVRTTRIVPPYVGRNERARQWMDDLYAAIWERAQHHGELGPLDVLLDESVGPTSGNYAPPHLELVITQGRKKMIRHSSAQQDPVGAYPQLLSQAQHAFIFLCGMRPDYLDAIGRRVGWTGAEVGTALQELADEHGYLDNRGEFKCHAYLRHRMGRREVNAFPPLPAEVISHTRRHVINDT
jgi:hypothetical protein